VTTTARERLNTLLGGEGLAFLRERLRRRYERRSTVDVFTLNDLSVQERRALEGLLGRRSRESTSMQVATSELDEALSRAGLATSLRDALEQLDGPINDVVGERERAVAAWDQVFSVPRESRLTAALTAVATRSTLKRLAGGQPAIAERLLTDAERVLERLPVRGVPLPRLAADVLGDSHGLDKRCPVASVVLMALGKGPKEDAREVWARAGVLVSEYAKPALLFNVPVSVDSACRTLIGAAYELAEPLQLSLRTLLRQSPNWQVKGRRVFVTENSTVVGMAADHLGSRCPPIVCTDGVPAAAQQALLRQLVERGANLFYHGDFDWPGIAIANFVMRTYGAKPWRFRTEDFQPQIGFPLAGEPIVSEWDPDLTAKMATLRLGLHEEAVIERLLEDLAADQP
jgi:uncharacterized protein (TIGR02679 family)